MGLGEDSSKGGRIVYGHPPARTLLNTPNNQQWTATVVAGEAAQTDEEERIGLDVKTIGECGVLQVKDRRRHR